MATLSQAKSRRMYSWWWDSHISPKNSKWLQDNLTDMDSKVKAMIKLIEEDADSFARRAEMYYKKRPELMKLVEEFYRAYRALAERYDHATVVIRQAHRTMSEAFPNQDPSVLVDDSPANSGSGDDSRTPEVSTPPRVLFQTDDLQRNGLELSPSHVHHAERNGEHTEFSDSEARRNGLRPSNDLSESGDYPKLRVRKGLNFDDEDEKELSVQSDDDHRLQAQAMAGADQVGRSEEILILKKALAELEAEKEAGIVQYQNSLEKLSKLESEISHAQEDSRKFNERASIAEAEVQKLKEALAKLQAEKDNNLLGYHRCLDKISSLEKILSQAEVNTGELNERARKAESEAQSLRDELEKVTSEKDAALDQYVLSLEKISNLENGLEFAEEDAKKLSERAEKAENQIETLKQEISKFSEEKEVAAIQLKQCLESISSLESKLLSAQEEVQNLRIEIDHGISKLKDSEKQRLLLERSNQSLHAELESLTLKMDAQDQELIEKQKELGRLWTCIQEEHLRFVEAETAFQTLQHLHAKTQEEIQSLAMELQNRVQILKEVEAHNQKLQDEVLKVKEENASLSELNVSSAISVKNMQEEIFMLKETKGKLQEELELRVDQRNALQQEIYCLKEELNNLNKKHLNILEQVDAVGLSPECVKSSVKELQAVNSNLKEICEREKSEKEGLLGKLEIMGQLLEKNSILENSLLHLSAELEAARGKIKALKESCQSLLQEKSNLLDEKAMLGSQLQAANENLEQLSEHNTVLEKTLSDACDELQTMKAKLKTLEDSCQLLAGEKADLASERDILGGQLESTRLIVEELERRFAELEERYLIVEKEKASALSKIGELQVSLHKEKQEHANFAQMNETWLGTMQYNMHLLQEECQARKREFDTELDRALHSEIEIFIVQRCAQDLKETNLSLLVRYQKLQEASKISENVISELQKDNVEKTKEVKSLSHQASTLREGMLQMLKALDIVWEDACQDSIGEDLLDLTSILHNIEDTKRSFGITEVENLKLALEKMVLVTLLQQLSFEAEHLEVEKMSIEQELKIQMDRIFMLRNEALRLHEMNEELKLKLRKKDLREEALVIEVEDLQRNLLDVQGSLQDLKHENLKILEEKQSLIEESALLKDNNKNMEGENYIIFHKMLSMAYLSLIFENYIGDKTFELKELNELVGKLQGENGAIRGKLSSTEKELVEAEMLNSSLRDMLHKSEDELKVITATGEKLSHELLLAKDLLDEEQGKTKIQEETLQAELQKQMNEIEIWETQAAEIFSQLQKSTVFQVLYEQKVRELIEACNSLRHANVDKDTDIKLLKERLSTSASENEGLNAQLAALGPAITSLRECIASLESRTSQRKLQKPTNEELQGAERTNDMRNHSLVKDDNLKVIDASLDLQDLVNRVRVIEQTVVEMEQLVLKENSKVHSQLESALRQIEDLKSESSRHRRNLKPKSEISEVENALIMKDIVLDQVSECSSNRISRREQVELWETADLDHSIGLTVGKAKKMVTPSPEKRPDLRRLKSTKKKRREFPASDALVEKELGVDKLEISKKSVGSQEGNDRKVLQRLNSDIQKLTNLQITVQDLTKKIEIIEKSRKGKAIDETDTLKEQLEGAEATILKLFNLNAKLMKNIEDSSVSDMKSTMESEDSESVRTRRISEQARRISEKVGRLQLEVQKIQFVLLKLDDEKESKGKIQMSESRRRVLLRDFLYGGSRISQSKRKKAPFCGCVQPPTRGD